MPSFLEKLKKGMGIDENSLDPKKELAEETKEKEEGAGEPTEKLKPIEKKKSSKRKLARKKIVEEIEKEEEAVNPEAEKPATRPSKKAFVAKVPSAEPEIMENKPEEKQEILPKSKKIEVRPIPTIKTNEEEPSLSPSKVKEKNWFESEGQLVVDVYQTDGEIVIQAAIAGVKPENLDINIENDVVIIRGAREKTSENESINYFYQECYWGRFSREIILPAEVDGSRASALMKEGVLTIRIPKIEREKKRKIVIRE